MLTHDRLHAPGGATGSIWLDGDFLTQENEGVNNLVTAPVLLRDYHRSGLNPVECGMNTGGTTGLGPVLSDVRCPSWPFEDATTGQRQLTGST